MKRFFTEEKDKSSAFLITSLIVLAAVVTIFIVCTGSMSSDTTEKQIESLENAVITSVTYCYAIEGSYPEDVEYLEENYGLTYNKERFFVGYRLHGTNIMPDITIVDLEAKI